MDAKGKIQFRKRITIKGLVSFCFLKVGPTVKFRLYRQIVVREISNIMICYATRAEVTNGTLHHLKYAAFSLLTISYKYRNSFLNFSVRAVKSDEYFSISVSRRILSSVINVTI